MRDTWCSLWSFRCECDVWVDGAGSWNKKSVDHSMVSYMFMHACLCTVWFHAWRWICMDYLHQCLNSICGLEKKKKRRPQGLKLPVLIGKLIMSLWVGYLRVCVCLWKIQDLSLEAACDRGSSVLLTPPPSPCSDRTTGERTEVLPSPAEGRYAARNPSRTIALSPVQIKHWSMCVVMRSCVFVWDLSVSGLLPTVADLAEFFTAVDICPSQHVLL